MKNKVIYGFALCFLASLLLTGCGPFSNKIPELTDEQKDMVVEYATESLLHYDHKNGDKIKPSEKYEIVTDEGEIVDADTALEAMDISEEGTLQMPEEEYFEFEEPMMASEEEASLANSSIVDALGLMDVSLDYMGYEIVNDYKENPDDYFVLNATEGDELVIIKYMLTNESSEDRIISMPYGEVRYKISLNGNTKNALTTLLLNDMAFFADNVPAYGSREVIVVGEFTKEELETVSSLSLILKKGDENISFSLQ